MVGVLDWWHYLLNVYIINTSKGEKFIANSIIEKHPGLLFLVVQVNLRVHNGVLPKRAWEWITRKTQTVLRIKPAPAPKSLSDLLQLPPKPPLRPTDPLLDALLRSLTNRA